MAHLEYHFDIVCPYAYLGSTQIKSIVDRCNASISWHPVLLGGILRSVGMDPMFTTKLPTEKMRHNLNDMYRWADQWGIDFKFHPRHPMRTVTVQRTLIAAGPTQSLIDALYRAYWVDNRDLDDDTELASVLNDAGLDGNALIEQTQDPNIKLQLRSATDRVVERGAFGVPAMFVGETLIWGQDRLHFVERLLQGGTL